jgi:hypothetical protein
MKKYKLDSNDIKKLIEVNGGCIATDKITVDGMKVGYMYRENPTNENDSGWRFFAGDEDETYTNNPDNYSIFDLNTICNYDSSIIPYLSKPIGIKLERNGEAFNEINE